MRAFKQDHSTINIKNVSDATAARLDNTNQTLLSTEFCVYVHGILMTSLFTLAILR